MKSQEEIHEVDKHVGANIRARRREMGLSQEALASACGVSFQQVQKYERGTNRVSASMLWEICRVLQCTPNDLIPSTSLDQPTGVMPSKLFREIILKPNGDQFLRNAAKLPDWAFNLVNNAATHMAHHLTA